MELYQNKFVKITYDQEARICIGNWTEETSTATADDFKEWNQRLVEKIEQYKPMGFLANTLNYKFIITPDLQEWSATNVFGRFAKAGVIRIALTVPEDFYSQVALEQFVDEYEGRRIKNRYFSDLGEAKTWLTSLH
ncbi:hypothetical protein [Microscilla marina]|nr:hypothetical protein [Microscilla marina]